jgi:hypothetical protein
MSGFGWAYKLLCPFFVFMAIVGCPNIPLAQEPDYLTVGSTWNGKIYDGKSIEEVVLTISARLGERIRGTIGIPSMGTVLVYGSVIDNKTVAWFTIRYAGIQSIYPAHYVGTIRGKELSGMREVPKTGQYGMFLFRLAE